MAKFALVGVINTGVDFVIFIALVYGLSMLSIWAQFISYGFGVINSYWWNRKWTFRSEGQANLGEMLRFFVLTGSSFAAATALLLVLEHGMGWWPILAKALSVAVSVAVNYAGSKFWVFRMESRQNRAG